MNVVFRFSLTELNDWTKKGEQLLYNLRSQIEIIASTDVNNEKYGKIYGLSLKTKQLYFSPV